MIADTIKSTVNFFPIFSSRIELESKVKSTHALQFNSISVTFTVARRGGSSCTAVVSQRESSSIGGFLQFLSAILELLMKGVPMNANDILLAHYIGSQLYQTAHLSHQQYIFAATINSQSLYSI